MQPGSTGVPTADPNPNACRVVLRRRGPLEVFDLTLRFLQRHPGPFARMVAVTVGPLAVVAPLGCWLADGHLGLLALPIVAAPLLQAPVTLLAGRLLFAEQVRVRDVLREIGRRPGALLAAALGWWVPLVVGCGVLSWIGGILLCWITEVALLEEAPSDRIMRRTTRLSRLHVGVSMSVVLSWYVLTAWGAMAGETTGQAVFGTILQLGEPFGNVFDGRVTPFVLIGMALAQPVFGVFRLLAYLDVRTRAEGWDLQVALRALGLAVRVQP